ncbi:MAG: DNA-binding domain-containing protein [Rhodovulum sp.]
MTGQDVFAAALMDPGADRPGGLTGARGGPAGRRFDVYRNNVVASLIEALETGFPVVRALVGAAFFRAMAGDFVRAHPPRSPLLMLYGEALPGFLGRFDPVAHLPYLPDIARLELALRESYHAADAPAVDPGALAALPPAALAHARLTLAPSVRLLRSNWPIHAIWQAHHGGPRPRPGAQEVLVARPGFDPVPQLLPAGGYRVLGALRAGVPLGAALSDLQESNIPALLQLLLNTRAITAITFEDSP